MKCDTRAFAQCPTHRYCGLCAADADFMEGSECDKFNQSVLSKPMTNADRIRAMTDEELEAFLVNVDLEKEGSPFITEWGKWLQQPAEGDA